MNRVKWLDVAKGLGIFFVIYSHFLASGNDLIKYALYSFHMPLFFIISGYVAKKTNLSKIKFIGKSFYKYVLPAIIWAVVGVFVMIIYKNFDLKVYIAGIINYDSITTNRPLWYFWVLFYVVVLYQLLCLYKCSVKVKTALIILCFIITYLIIIFNFKLHFGLCKIFVCLGFYLLGSIFAEIKSCDFVKKILIRKHIIFPILFVVWFISSCFLNPGYISINHMKFGSHFYMFIISSISGSLFVFYIAYLLKDNKFLNKCGQNTMIIVCTHYLFVVLIRVLCKNIIKNDVFLFLASIVLFIFYYFIFDFVNKYLYFLFGNKKVINN